MKEPHGDGYISPAVPHAINSILVDDLGREEVLLLVTDSGNVCGYRVEAIFSALKRAAENKEPHPLDGSQVDPFFVEYVGVSAWGLAIHKFARLIAVSANTGLVTVFAFALINPGSTAGDDLDQLSEDEDDFTDYGQTWLHIRTSDQLAQLRHLMPYKHRTRNIKLTYTGHFANIPSVSFLNCDLDPNGMWMVSTDIDNKLLVWKVWESLGPFNVYHFNDITFKSFPETLRNDERGWSVIALDPRTFHWLKSTEEACGGQPQRRSRDGQTVLDLTKLSYRVPNASHLYNYFPPAAKAEPDQPFLPDIFEADCCISGNTGPFDPTDPEQAQSSHSALRDLRPSNSADAFSHRAVNGSVRGDNLSYSSMSEDDGNPVADLRPPQDRFDGETSHTPDAPARGNAPAQGSLSTPEFLQFALLEALGGDIPGTDDYFDDYYIEEDDLGDLTATELMVDNNGDTSDEEDEDTSMTGAVYEALEPPVNANFPILHFSQTDIRLVPHPFAPHASVVCESPLRQPFTHPIVSIRACDRFNMVKYVPEHGIVVAASQKGRAAIIALTESEETGLAFRIDWIVPFESQEKYGDRPLIPLLGMSVSPIQGFELPPDVPYIPRSMSDSDVSFHYKHTNHPEAEMHTKCTPNQSEAVYMSPRPSDNNEPNLSTPISDGRAESDSDNAQQHPLTLPECHARATHAYHPEEDWRGWNPSRRYRLLLIYADHTVMSYEFWYNWSPASTTEEESDEDYLVV
ncbi:hypothetical protein FE257_004168 [Aspergillus nanangensis]|uniref:Uncharacterized protein n=1 Tax=Aspergillus nanangensis TaxID=2582783 RepID=A0AAD4GX92_ASPNN|nr:hypothetical protein FE257_004168 [Aspergillus nanangensis]